LKDEEINKEFAPKYEQLTMKFDQELEFSKRIYDNIDELYSKIANEETKLKEKQGKHLN